MASNRGKPPRPNADIFPSDNETYTIENKVTLQSINQRMTIHPAMVSNYATQWGPIEAFRELQEFTVVLEEDEDEIVYKAIASGSSRRTPGKSEKCLGYIRWARRNGAGFVDITNRQATLEPWHLDMGSTSKKNDKNQAGMHGEGLKVALLVLMRGPHNHAVRCLSGGFSWTFNFTSQRRLVACPVRMTPDAVMKVRDQARSEVNRTLLPIAVNPGEDVQFLIGAIAKGRDEGGYPTERNEVTREEFENWTRAAIFLQKIADGGIIKTKKGDLITDSRFSGSIYLKGLLLKESQLGRSASITGKKMYCGYNFAAGATNRERESMATADDESRKILAIWNQALLTQASLIGQLHKLLNSNTEFADVDRAELFTQQETKDRIRAYILEEFKHKWCCTAKERSQNPRLLQIIHGLNRTALQVKEPYWAILKDSGFMTAEEMEKKLFKEAISIPIPQNLFSRELHLMIRAGFECCPLTANTTVTYVKAGWLGLDSLYLKSEAEFKIHEKWSTMVEAKSELGISHQCWMSWVLLGATKRLLSDAFSQIPLSLFNMRDGDSPSWHRKQVISESDQRVLELIQIKKDTMFSIKDCGKLNRVGIEWSPNTAWSRECKVTVQFHRESTCSHLKELLTAKKVINTDIRCCTDTRGGLTQFPNTTCFTTTVPYAKKSYEILVEKGQKYFALLYNPEDLGSLVILRGKPVIVAEDRLALTVDTTSKENQTHGQEYLNTYGKALRLSLTLGDKVESLDIMTPRDWFRGPGMDGKKVIIGVEKVDSIQAKVPLRPQPSSQLQPPVNPQPAPKPRVPSKRSGFEGDTDVRPFIRRKPF
ncbi:hypothetical protein F4804DRAFT_330804 [Jackrogersella minutella]|nr:hypothetical protein F4804DRAFT_330804 [Jackrogersella minutella]